MDARGPLPLSVAIVCKDNERTIGRTLESVAALSSEIVAVDSGSTDGTIALLEAINARVIRSDWLGHVRTKQMALEACTRPWILCLDSDESLEPRLVEAIRALLENDPPEVSGARVNRKVWYRGRFLEHAWQPERRLRLVRRGAARWGGLDPHDKLEIVEDRSGLSRVIDLAGDLRHDSFRTFAEQLDKQFTHARVMAESLHRAGRRGSRVRAVVSPAGALLKQIVVKGAWRDGVPGWLAALCTSAATLQKHAILLELDALASAGGGPSDTGSGSRPGPGETDAGPGPGDPAA